MGAQISLSTSRHLPPGLHVPPNAAAALIADGWQPPPTQEPTGSFLLPKGGPMKLTRHQADVALRRLTDLQYREMARQLPVDASDPDFREFHRKLSWQIGADLDRGGLQEVLECIEQFSKAETPGDIEYAESDLNFTVNNLLDAAGFRGPHNLRYSEQEPAA